MFKFAAFLSFLMQWCNFLDFVDRNPVKQSLIPPCVIRRAKIVGFPAQASATVAVIGSSKKSFFVDQVKKELGKVCRIQRWVPTAEECLVLYLSLKGF